MNNLADKKNKIIEVTFNNNNQNCTLSLGEEFRCVINSDSSKYRKKDIIISTITANQKQISGNDLKDCLLYRTDRIKLPRNKVELLKDKYNVAITRNIDKADYIVTSTNKIESMFLGCSGWSVTNDEFKKIIKKHNHLLKGYEDDLNSIEADVISFTFHNVSFEGWHGNSNKAVKKAPGTLFKKEICNNRSVYQVFNIYEEDLFDTIQSTNSNIVFDTSIGKIISDLSPEVTDEVFENLLSMVTSNDPDNVALALEIISNSNFDKSLDKIAYIYNFYYEELKQCKNWNSINVKTLRSVADNYMTYGNRYHANKYSSFISKINANNRLTKVVAEKVCEDFTNAVMQNAGLNSSLGSKIFKISKIKLRETIKVEDSVEETLPF